VTLWKWRTYLSLSNP